MTPERAAGLVAWWVRWYTRDLPGPAARRRIDELHADLHDHIAHGRAQGAAERQIALSLLSRMVRGLPADVAWRRRTRSSKGHLMKTLLAIAVVVLGVAAVLLGGADDSPGLQLIGVLLVVGAITLSVRTARRSG